MIFYLKFNKSEIRDFVLGRLQSKGIYATFHYIPLHNSPMGQKLGYRADDLKVTSKVGATILRLPLYPELSNDQLTYILDNIADIFEKI
jgi:dTDP-4-amino-4,6-dideoxygalactose transaminase